MQQRQPTALAAAPRTATDQSIVIASVLLSVVPSARTPVTVTVRVPFVRYTCCSTGRLFVAVAPSPKSQLYDAKVSFVVTVNLHS